MGRKLFLLAAFATCAGAALLFLACGAKERQARPGFVATREFGFVVDGKPFRFTGANVAVLYRDEERARMSETLRQAALDSISVVRVWAFGESGEDDGRPGGVMRSDWLKHPFRRGAEDWNEEAFESLDRVIAEAARQHLRVLICLGNWWRDTGGIVRYIRWAGLPDAADDTQPYGINIERALAFYTNAETRRLYREHVERIVGRRNSITGKFYRDDPTIFGYELMNEAQAPTGRFGVRRAWIAEMSAYVKSLDPDHLVAPGVWGYRTSFERREWLKDHSLPTVDYCDAHIYPRDDTDSFVDSPDALRDFIDNRAAAAFSINKPLVLTEFGMTPDGYKGVSQTEWFRTYFESSARDGVGGAIYWTFTPDPQSSYDISYTTDRNRAVREEFRRAAHLFAELQNEKPPARLLDSSHHLIPRQFAFTREANDPAMLPEIIKTERDARGITYLFKPEMAASARFEKLGGGLGYIWGSGVGFVEYLVPAREKPRAIKTIKVRAHLQPVLPQDAQPPVSATRVTLYVNGVDCGSRVIPIENPKQQAMQEWTVDAYDLLLSTSAGLPLKVRFAVKVDADQPFGLNISNFSEWHEPTNARPMEVQLK